jgi:predicted Zn-dependent protease
MHGTIEIYLLYLLWFYDERVVFKEEELRAIGEKIWESMKSYIESKEKKGPWEIYQLKKEFVQKIIENESSGNSGSLTIKSADMGYYHYRIIFRIISDFKGEFRDLRRKIDKLKENCDKEVTERIIKEVNSEVGKRIRLEGKIVGYCSYPLIIWKGKPTGKFPFSDDTTAMSFDIFDVGLRWILRRHTVRISRPRMVVYTRGMSDKLKRDIINAIYQHILYRMEMRKEDTIDEMLLTELWSRMIDTLPRMRSELYLLLLTFILVVLTLLALLPSLFSLFSSLFTLIKNVIFTLILFRTP